MRVTENPIMQAHALQEQMAETRKYAAKLIDTCSKIEAGCTRFIRSNPKLVSPNFEGHAPWVSEMNRLVGRVREYAFCCYKELVTPQTFLGQRAASVAAIEDFQDYNHFAEDIFTDVIEGNLLVKLPLLWNKYEYTRWTNGHKWTYDYLAWFTRNLDSSLTLIDEKIPPLREKHLHYMFVISSRRAQASDSDNYDTKAITDAIVAHTFGGDGALACSFSYCSFADDDLPEGTYITISPGFGNVPDFSLNMHMWKSVEFGFKK